MELRERISRWILAVGLWGCALWLAKYGYANDAFEWFIPALIIGSVGTSRVFSDLLELAAKPFTAIVDAIIFPKVAGDKPPPNYKLTEYYLEEERWDDAETEYLTILKNHSKETQAYLTLV